MRERLLAAAATALSAAFLSGCAVETFTYTIDRYGTVKSQHVHLGCRDTYEVFDRPDARTLLVTTGPINEGIATLCGGAVATLPTAERMRRAASLFLAETSERPECHVIREQPISDRHAEFGYSCPAPAPARRGR